MQVIVTVNNRLRQPTSNRTPSSICCATSSELTGTKSAATPANAAPVPSSSMGSQSKAASHLPPKSMERK